MNWANQVLIFFTRLNFYIYININGLSKFQLGWANPSPSYGPLGINFWEGLGFLRGQLFCPHVEIPIKKSLFLVLFCLRCDQEEYVSCFFLLALSILRMSVTLSLDFRKKWTENYPSPQISLVHHFYFCLV